MHYESNWSEPSSVWPLITAAARMLRPPEFATPDAWADDRRVMPPGSPFPGPWQSERTPWLAEPSKAAVDPQTDIIVMMLASQMAKTEFGLNVLGHMWDTHPAPAMWVTPTERLAHSMSKDRINALFDSTPDLWDKTRKPVRPGSLERYVSGVRFGLAWAGSPTELASHPCKYVVIDERSRMGNDVGNEGDPARVVMARTKMYAGSKVLILSSPTVEDECPTYRWWLQGTKMRWCWRCPGCGDWLFPSLALAAYPQGADFAEIRANSWIECPECARQIRDEDRASIEARYIPSVVDDGGTLHLAPELEVVNSVKSYWATGFASLITGIGRIMEEYARAARTGEPGDVQAVVNTYCGELWKYIGEGVPADAVRDCQIAQIPDDDIQLITVGVDVQADCVYYVVRGWCAHVTSYLIDHGRIMGATEYTDVWLELARAIEGPFFGRGISLALVDSGYSAAQVYQQCRMRATWAPSKGRDTMDAPWKDSLVDETASGRALKTLKLWLYSADTWKSWLYGRIQWPLGELGAWYVPEGIDDDYCAQVVNERHRVRAGKRQWYPTGNRQNHYLDCEVMAAVAADICGVRRLKSRQPPEVEAAKETVRRAASPPPGRSVSPRQILGGQSPIDW